MTSLDRRYPLRRAVFHGLVVAGMVFAAYLFLVASPIKGSLAFDVVAYWQLDLADPYHGQVGDLGFFPYSPAVALVIAPLSVLPWQAFVVVWYVLLVGALGWMGRRHLLVLLAFPPVAVDLYHGNIHLLIAAALVAGFRWPAAWSFLLLSKVTPGVALLWFVARREWRNLTIALGATTAIVGVTAALLPTQWVAWVTMLAEGAGTPPPWPALPIPLLPRLAVAAGIVWWGARRDARWVVPLAAAISVPALWPGAFAILAACWPLRGAARRERVDRTPAVADYHAPDVANALGESRRGRAPSTA